MHGDISSISPADILFGVSGSASDCLPQARRSALPDNIASIASTGSFILPTPMIGTETAFLISSASDRINPGGISAGGTIYCMLP
jgi:hypothetical protein